MASTAQLRERWNTPAGQAAVEAIEDALRFGAEPASLAALIAGLPLTEEVAPALDFRGIEIPSLVAVKKTDLSGARFDAAKMNWNFGGSILRSAVFDGAEGRNVDFGGCDLTGGSFVKARLPGAILFGARLHGANLTGIQMRGGQLKNADCRNAKFAGADLRAVWAADTDLRGADLSDANLVGASLGDAKWDDTTLLTKARLGLEGTPPELQAFAIAQGASVVSEKPEWQLGLLDATVRALQNEPGVAAGPIADRLKALRKNVERDAGFAWANVLQSELDAAQWQMVQEAVRKAASNMGALLG